MKKSLILLVLVVLISLVSASVRINEVMAKTPKLAYGDDNCQWIELFSTSYENLTNWILNTPGHNLTLNVSVNNFLIITGNDTCFKNNWGNVNESKIIEWSAISLNDGGDNVSLFNNSRVLVDFIEYPSFSSYTNKSYSLLSNSSWIICDVPTPGSENNCLSSAQPCIQNWSCMNWGTCSNGIQTRTCIDLNDCSNATGKPAESQSCTNSSEIYLEMNWNEEDIINGQEFEIEIKAYNLKNEKYNVKVWIEFEDNDTIISDRYGEDSSGEEVWKSGSYYVYNLFNGPGNKTEAVNLRIRENYKDFKGDAKIFFKLSTGEEISKNIEILEKKEENKEDDSPQPEETIGKTVGSYEGNSSFTGSVIHLGGLKEKEESKIDEAKTNTNIIYESKNELIKKYSLLGFALLCTALSILLVLNKLN